MSDAHKVSTADNLGRNRWSPITSEDTAGDMTNVCPLPPPLKIKPPEHVVKCLRSALAWKKTWRPAPTAPLGKCISLGGSDDAYLCPKVLGGVF